MVINKSVSLCVKNKNVYLMYTLPIFKFYLKEQIYI